ncbi:unnamed protein product [Clonostachys solani]|uniref:Chorismate mutase domain-containing protein n=1 Tax=Clonostachys solani TaxID=160281 RepID=A0A9P0EN26_9HYPO|nr:unnamed protein product [Clonostachys solani]
MRASTLLFGLPLTIVAAVSCRATNSTCHFVPSINATATNYPRADKEASFPYDITVLSQVPVADICTSPSGSVDDELACARKYIDAIDEQMAFLYARRLGYAAVAGHAKYRNGTDLNDASRNAVVAEGMARRVLKYGGSEEVGRVMGGEACQIYASLLFEEENIQDVCNPDFKEDIPRPCDAF